ncbi:MAG: hypothetical protein ABIQ44_04080 [Chloroflexia bacterium]
MAKPRLMDLLKLKIRHVYETTPGHPNSKLLVDGIEVEFKSQITSQPYKHIERFLAEDKVTGFIVNPGLLPIVKAISTATRGRKLLVTRKIAERNGDAGLVAHLNEFGIRIMMAFDSESDETTITWECLYAVA